MRKRRLRNGIPGVDITDEPTIQFSFKHLDTTSSKFSVDSCSSPFWIALAYELKRYSLMSVDEFVGEQNSLGRHIIDFTETSEPEGFSKLGLGEGEDSYAWQFAVGPKGDGWRVVGLISDNVFFIVWLDSQHALYTGRQ